MAPAQRGTSALLAPCRSNARKQTTARGWATSSRHSAHQGSTTTRLAKTNAQNVRSVTFATKWAYHHLQYVQLAPFATSPVSRSQRRRAHPDTTAGRELRRQIGIRRATSSRLLARRRCTVSEASRATSRTKMITGRHSRAHLDSTARRLLLRPSAQDVALLDFSAPREPRIRIRLRQGFSAVAKASRRRFRA